MKHPDPFLSQFFSSASTLLGSFSNILFPQGDKMAVAAPNYIFSSSGPILRGATLASTVGTSPEPLGRVSIPKAIPGARRVE